MASRLVMEKDVVDLTVDSSTDSDDVECISENSTNFKDSVDEDCTLGDDSSLSNSELDACDESGSYKVCKVRVSSNIKLKCSLAQLD